MCIYIYIYIYIFKFKEPGGRQPRFRRSSSEYINLLDSCLSKSVYQYYSSISGGTTCLTLLV